MYLSDTLVYEHVKLIALKPFKFLRSKNQVTASFLRFKF